MPGGSNRVPMIARRGRRIPRVLTAAVAVGLLGSSVSIAMVAVGSRPASAAPAVSLYVTTTGSGSVCSQASPCGSIQTAITTAEAGGDSGDDVTINVAAGSYTEIDTISASSLNSLTIAGAGASITTANGNASGTVFGVIGGTVTISGLTITNGSAVAGGGIDIASGTVTVNDSTLSDNTANHGGGAIYQSSGTLILNDSTLSDNMANNTCAGGGGILEAGGTVTVNGSTLSGNSTNSACIADGGGILQSSGTVTVTNSTLSNNSATGNATGGGIDNVGGTLTVTNSTLSNNSATGAGSGGGIAGSATVTVMNSTISDNNANYEGGGIIVNGGTFTVTSSTVSGNTAGGACGCGAAGGGIYNAGTLTVTNSTLSGNTASTGPGGGIDNHNATVTVTNSTLSGNSAANGGGPGNGGGAIHSYEGSMFVIDSTVSGNIGPAGFGGGILANFATTFVGATILANNPGDDCSGFGVDQYNIADDATCGIPATGTLDASLGALGNNGGPTQTILPAQTIQPSPTSPAVRVIPTGTTLNSVSVCPRTDQRGVASVGNCTIGAVEVPPGVQPDPPVIGAVSAGNVSVTVSFTPGSPGSGPILSFGVSCNSLNGGIDGVASGTASPIVVSGLTNGKTYTCAVFAQNGFGTSGLSGSSIPFVPSAAGTVPTAPSLTAVTAGNGSALVTFIQPASNGGNSIAQYTVSCVSSDGGTNSSGNGANDPTSTSQLVSVPGLSNGHTYTCTVTATNVNGTGPSSDASAPFVPAATVSCTNTQTCTDVTAAPVSSASPAQTVQVTGIPTAANGSVTVTSAPALLNCPGVPPAIASVTTLTDTGFPKTSSLKATVTQLAVATSPGKVCYHSITPFRSVSHPTTPKAGTFILLACTAVANVAPCQVSSQQTSTAIIVKFLAAGGDPLFKVVVPTGRLVWPSTFPTGKVGTTYGAHLQSSGGKAPFDWKVDSGKLAPGLALSASTGAITGKPTAKGTFACRVVVTDGESPPQSATISVSITIT
jgi:hypothetical protein